MMDEHRLPLFAQLHLSIASLVLTEVYFLRHICASRLDV